MRSARIWGESAAMLAAGALALLAAPGAARANIIGGATVTVNRISGQPGSQTFPMAAGDPDYETPVASLSASLAFPGQPPSLRANARAVAGVDLAHGAFYGTISTFSRMEAPGVSSRATANALVAYEETLQVLSDTLPDGTVVDVSFDLMIRLRGSGGAGGFGACCSIGTTYEASIEGNIVPFDSSWAYLPRSGAFGVLAGGVDDQPIELGLGRYSAPALVGGSFYLGISFELSSTAIANAVFNPATNRYVPGQSEAAGSAALFVSTEVTPAGGGAAAARAPGGSAYLYSPAGGFALPGAEVFDPANLQAHWLSPISVPEPGTAALATLGLVLLGTRERSARARASSA